MEAAVVVDMVVAEIALHHRLEGDMAMEEAEEVEAGDDEARAIPAIQATVGAGAGAEVGEMGEIDDERRQSMCEKRVRSPGVTCITIYD